MKKEILCGIMLTLLAMSVLMTALPARSSPTTVLSVQPISIVDSTLVPGSKFRLNVTIADVQHLYGYQTSLWFAPGILHVIKKGFGCYPPLSSIIFLEISNETGYVAWGAEGGTLSTVDPKPIAWIDFIVEGIGNTTLHFDPNYTVLMGVTEYVLVDGYFDNTPQIVHDVAITDVSPSKTSVRQGQTLNISVTAANQGDVSETSNVTAYANATIIGAPIEVTLASAESSTIIFTWDTTDFAKGNYTISAYITPVPAENDTTNNSDIDGKVQVVYPGDVNQDGTVNMQDAALISAHWYPGPPRGPLGYDPNIDLNNDGAINILDKAIVSAYWTGPPKGPLDP